MRSRRVGHLLIGRAPVDRRLAPLLRALSTSPATAASTEAPSSAAVAAASTAVHHETISTWPRSNDSRTLGRTPSSDRGEAILPAETNPHSRATPRELQFFATFTESEGDLHWELLVEAHRKHGVWLSVPPQLPPTIPHVGPPAIPEVVLPARQRARMAEMQLAYAPTHAPPPLRTTGSRALQVDGEGLGARRAEGGPSLSRAADTGGNVALKDAPRVVSDGVTAVSSHHQTEQQLVMRTDPADLPEQERVLMERVRLAGWDSASPSATTTTTTTTAPSSLAGAPTPATQTVRPRALVDPSMRFHCGRCGKAFRKRESAAAHVTLAHAGGAKVVEGPGLGEMLGQESVGTSGVSTATAGVTPLPPVQVMASPPAAVPARASGSRVVPSPTSVRPVYSEAAVALPSDETVERLLLQVWDVVALAREDIVKPKGLTMDTAAPSHSGSHAVDASVLGESHDHGRSSAAGARVLASGSAVHPHGQRVWDSAGGTVFIPAALVVEGMADRRKELEALHAMKPPARATPEGAAPGVKRRAAVGAHAEHAARPIQELNKQYPNPFGANASASAALMVELEKEPVNPFVDLAGRAEGGAEGPDLFSATPASADTSRGKEGALRSGHALTARLLASKRAESGDTLDTDADALLQALLARPFRCPLCPDAAVAVSDADSRFRLLDGLLHHLDSAHVAEGGCDALDDAQWAELYAADADPVGAVEREYDTLRASHLFGSGDSSGNGCSAGGGSSSASGGDGGDHRGEDGGEHVSGERGGGVRKSGSQPSAADGVVVAAETGEDTDAEAFVIPTVPLEQVTVHARSSVNTILVGTVADIQEGYLGNTPTMQFVIAVRHPVPRPSVAEEGVGEVVGNEDVEMFEEELVVVRCVGTDAFVPRNLLRQRIHLQSRVFVEGSLRMNRHVDAASKRSHAYPFIQVAPPLGSIRAL